MLMLKKRKLKIYQMIFFKYIFRVIYNKHEGPKKKFAVCVKGLDFPDDDLSVRLGNQSIKFIFIDRLNRNT